MTPAKITTGPLKVKSALNIVALALAAGVAFDWLVRDALPGLGFVLFASLIVVSVPLVRRPRRKETYVLLTAAWSLAAWVAIRSAEYLAALNICAALLLLSAAASSEVFDVRIWLWPIRDHVRSWLSQLRALCAGASMPIIELIRQHTSVRVARAMPYLRGFIIAVPVFAVFALLLASADLVFSDFLDGVIPSVDISIGKTGEHLIWIAALAWIAAGLYVFVAQPEKRSGLPVPAKKSADWEIPSVAGDPIKRPTGSNSRIGYIEVTIVLGSISALFALFVAFQFAYLFRGAAQIHLPGVTYAQYARAGFFQLLTVAVMTVALVWSALQIIEDELSGRQLAVLRAVCTLMIVLTLVILVSALKRLGLYEEVYGLTRMRLLSHVFTYLIGGVLILLVAQVYWERRQLLLAGTVALSFVALTALNAINPDAYIASRNLAQPDAMKRIDNGDGRGRTIGYISELSPDAVPTVLDQYARSPHDPIYERQLATWICWYIDAGVGWREWSLGRS